MIIVNLKGGLGNQMFQYACGRAIVLREEERNNHQELLLSDHSYTANHIRRYSLEPFNIKSRLAKKEELERVKYPYGILSKAWRFFAGRYLGHFAIKHFDPKYTTCKKDLFLDGFWQTEKYFVEFKENILEDFTLKNPLGESATKVAKEIELNQESVSIHFRRGDYVGNKGTDLQDPDYYNRAISKIKELISDPVFYIFSDEIEWIKKNIKLPEKTFFVSNPKIKDYEEIILMSKCSHNIIANSSFSWWGAWLNQNPDKIVITPKRWVNGSKEVGFRDIVPNSWVRV